MKMRCPKCLHKWTARVDDPKECPKCKNYLPKKAKNITVNAYHTT